MKYVLMLGGVGLGLLLGFLPSIRRPKPLWWRLFAIVAVTTTVVLALVPPIGGSIADVVFEGRAVPGKQVPALVVVDPTSARTSQDGITTLTATDARVSSLHVTMTMHAPVAAALRTAGTAPVIVLLRRGDNDLSFAADEVIAIDPLLTLPYITALEERARIIFFHVPMSWIATIAYLFAMIYGILYLRRRDLADDDAAAAMASAGTLFAVLATVTGSVWAKFNWGSFWNWDPRETSIVVLLLIYAAYFLLRSSIDEPQRRARLSSVYAIVAFVTVPFLIFILPRLLTGLHPGSKDDPGGIGPLLSPRSDAINPTKQVLFAMSLMAFTLVYFWMVNLRLRAAAAERRIAERTMERT